MLFTDVAFLSRFLPVVLGLYVLVIALASHRRTPRWIHALDPPGLVLLGAALVFVAAATSVELAAGALGLVGLNHGLGHAIAHARGRPEATGLIPEALITFGVWGHLLVWAAGKAWLPATGVGQAFSVPQLLVPIGLAVYVLHAVSHLLDIYRGDAGPHPTPVRTGIYLLFFPVLVAGPILRHRDLVATLGRYHVGMAAFAFGVRRFVVGLGKVWLIAGTLAGPADRVFDGPASDLSLNAAWLGVACFALQIYFDLSGYADMGIGLGRMLGFRLPESYRRPYAATSVNEFWRRWNLTLVGWADTYTRLGLGETTHGWASVWKPAGLLLFVGLWHGPAWGMVAWAVYHTVFVVVERRLSSVTPQVPGPLRHLYLPAVVALGWVLFRSDSLTEAGAVFQAMVGLGASPSTPVTELVTPVLAVTLVAAVVGVGPLTPWLSRWSVTVDAMTTSVLMLVWTTLLYSWRAGVGVGRLLVGRERR